MAGKIIADTIEAQGSFISLNVAGQTVLTANSSGLAYLPTGNVTINVVSGATQFANLGITTLTTNAIKFPGTQVASSDPNTLDDYEEGTWTPRFGDTSGVQTNISCTYTSNQCYGTYVKIGKWVHASAVMAWTAFTYSGSDSELTVSLPFTGSSATEHRGVASIPYNTGLTFSTGKPMVHSNQSGRAYTYFWTADSNGKHGGYVNLSNVLNGTGYFQVTVSYIANA